MSKYYIYGGLKILLIDWSSFEQLPPLFFVQKNTKKKKEKNYQPHAVETCFGQS